MSAHQPFIPSDLSSGDYCIIHNLATHEKRLSKVHQVTANFFTDDEGYFYNRAHGSRVSQHYIVADFS